MNTDNIHPIFKGIIQNFIATPKTAAKWEIQTLHQGRHWQNAWKDEYTGKAQVFDSYEDADRYLRNYLEACHLAVYDGDIKDHHDGDYRITVVRS